MANFPTSLDNGTTLPNPGATDKQNSPDHGSLHSNTNDAIKAVEAKLGTGSSTPTTNTLLLGTGTGVSAWSSITSSQMASIITDETGIGSAVFATTPTLVTPKVDTINEATLSNGVTVAGVNIKSGALTTSSSVPTVALASSAVTSDKVATGMPVQLVSTNFSAVATGTTIIPLDDTIPQITEGTEFMTQAITPKSATNILVIEAFMYVSLSITSADIIGALFQDSTANALAAIETYAPAIAGPTVLTIAYTMTAGTTSSTTFRIRVGGNSASTVTFNGASGARRFGTTAKSFIKITEYKA
jgi:hypothetical protein